jgi:hypothetical protein
MNKVPKNVMSKLESAAADYAAVVGKPFAHFYCPILRKDEETELCLGHVISKKFVSSNAAKVVQRKDVDNFFGTVAEADFTSWVEDHNKSLPELFRDPKAVKKHKPDLVIDGKVIPYYRYDGHTDDDQQHATLMEDGDVVCDLAVRLSNEEAISLLAKKNRAELVLDRDFRYAATASLIKAAHLSMFRLQGYRYVFDPAGLFVGDILKTFYDGCKNIGRRDIKPAMEKHFRKYGNMIIPLLQYDPTSAHGTVDDGRIAFCVGASGRPFAQGIFVRTNSDMNLVLIPYPSAPALDTFTGLLRELPISIVIRLAQWNQGNGDWDLTSENATRMYLRRGDGEGGATSIELGDQ